MTEDFPLNETPITYTIRRISGGARLIGLAWMLTLVVVASVREELEHPRIGWILAGLALAWGIVAVQEQLRHRASDPLWLTLGDSLLAGYAILAPALAGSDDLFYGGFPGIAVVAASANQRRLGWMVAGFLSLVTLVRLRVESLGQVVGQLSALITYLMLAAIVGWAVHVIYRTDSARRHAESEQAKAEAKTAMAAHLHDSVLQTLALIQREAGNEQRVTTLARRQEQDLRDWLYGARSEGPETLLRALERTARELEDLYGRPVEVVAAGDIVLDEPGEALLAAGREAIVNALKHSGAERVDVFLQAETDQARLYVRDRGRGFSRDEVQSDRAGIRDSIEGRLSSVGGSVTIRSGLGGTELEMVVTR